jgi:membrane protein implicated in regulation of membrane protease activity
MSAELIWIVAGFILIAVEMFVNAFIVIFFGIAAVLVGILLWLGMPGTDGVPYFVFGMLSVGLLLLLRNRFQSWFKGKSTRAQQDDDFLGRDAMVESGFDAASPHRGKVSYRGASWDARTTAGPFARGTYVRITDRDSSMLIVSALKE